MSLKENVSYIKDEISTQEKFFESFFQIERIYKKNKKSIFIIVGLAVVISVSMGIQNYLHEQKNLVSNEAYEKVLANPTDTQTLALLKEKNNTLYEIAQYKISNGTNATNVEYLKDIQAYEVAVQKGDIEGLDKLILNQNFLLKDFASMSKALILIEKNEYKKAKTVLATIEMQSNVMPIIDVLNHYLLTK